MKNIIFKAITSLALGLLALIGHPVSQSTNTIQPKALGATNQIETPVALFSTSLASPITQSATTMTLVSATTLDGTTLASSTYSFILDEGQSNQEFVKADCTATSCTNIQRGLSALTGTTTISGLAQAHRRGATVSITDAPLLINLTNILNGIGSFPNPLQYVSTLSTSTIAINRANIASVGLLQDTAFSGAGIINATANAKGVSQVATNIQAASSTNTGSSGALLLLPASVATSTYNPSSSLQVVVTKNNNKIDDNFISTSTLFSGLSLGTTTQIGAFPAYNIGKNRWVATSSQTTTFTMPSGITTVHIIAVGGAGGGGGGCGGGGSCPTTITGGNGQGGGGAGTCDGIYSTTTTNGTFSITIGGGGGGGSGGNTQAGSTGNTGGNTIISGFCVATGGAGGSASGSLSAGGNGSATASTTNTITMSGSGGSATGGGVSGGGWTHGGFGGVGTSVSGGNGSEGFVMFEW